MESESENEIIERIMQRSSQMSKRKNSKPDVILDSFAEIENLFDSLLLVERGVKSMRPAKIRVLKDKLAKRIQRMKSKLHVVYELLMTLRLFAINEIEPVEPDFETFEKLLIKSKDLQNL